MLLLGIDLETGNEFDKPIEENFITEIGAVLYDTVLDTPVDIYSKVLNLERPISEEAATYTGITQEFIDQYGVSSETELHFTTMRLQKMFAKADYVVAHNGNKFDKPIVTPFITKFGDTANKDWEKKQWLDSMSDVEYPPNCISKNLTYLQGFHGFCYPGHRAIFDVMAMLRIFNQYNIEQILTWANSPVVRIRAVTPNVNWKDPAEKAAMEARNGLLKKAGFRWDQKDYPKLWTKETKLIHWEKEKDKHEFQWMVIT